MKRFGWVLAALALIACTEVTGLVPTDTVYRVTDVALTSAVPGYSFRTLDTSVNRVLVALTGDSLSGAVRITGEWWLTLSAATGGSQNFAVLLGPYTGTYGVFGDTLWLDVRDLNGFPVWLDYTGFTRTRTGLRGRYDDGITVADLRAVP